MRLRAQTVDALNLFTVKAGALSESTIRIAQAMADVADMACCRLRSSPGETRRLQNALQSRVLIGQAKGVLAERLSIGTPRRSRRCDATRRASTSTSAQLDDWDAKRIDHKLDSTPVRDGG